jgi:uncharacterized membrane protein YccC
MPRLQLADPGLFALKSAARAAIVMPAVFAFADKVIRDPQVATFSAFGSFAMLLLADFGGSRRARLRAYLALAAAGAVLIVLGTLCSRNPWVAAGAMAVVGFVILFSGVINGYFAAGGTAAMLTFVLPVNLPASPAVIPARLEGWALAAAAGICAQMLLWPARPRDKLRTSIVGACLALADLVESARSDDPSPIADGARAAHEAVAAVQQQFLATPYRPSGPTGSAQAVAFLVDELLWFESFVLPPPDEETGRQVLCREENDEVMAAVVTVLRASAATLDGRDERPDLDRLDRALHAVVDGLARRVATLPPVRDDLELLAAVAPSFRMRTMSSSARQIGRNALLANGVVTPDVEEAQEARWYRPALLQAAALQATSTLKATERLAAEHASVRSVWFRNSLRGAAALAVAVFVAQTAGVQHAFWVVLGTLSVLRSNALGTGATVLRALAGTAVGIVVGAAVVIAIGTDTLVLWAVLPLAVLLAAYAPRVISFAAGQAGFTLTLLILFNIIQPTGWRVGLVRVEDVAIGFAISLVVGVLFWPRGAAALMRDSLATAYARSADYVVATLEQLVASSDPGRPRQAAQAAGAGAIRLDDAFRQYLAERSASVNVADVATLVAGATRVRRTALSLLALTHTTDGSPLRPGCAGALDGEVQALHAWYTGLADALLDRKAPPPPHQRDTDGRRRVVECMRQAIAGTDEGAIRPALALLWASQHLDNLWRLEAHLGEPSAEASTSGGQRVP